MAGADLRRLSPLAVDAGLGAVLVLIVAVEATTEVVTGARLGVLAAVTLVSAGCVALRRRTPMTALVVATAALVTGSHLQVATDFSPLATLVCAYSVGQYAAPVTALAGAPVVAGGVVGFFAASPGLQRTEPADLFSVLLVWLMAWGLGLVSAQRRIGQERAQRALERQVVAEERVRVSRELHDVIGHTVNLFVVQAGAARLTLDSDPGTARSLLQRIEDTGRTTLTDLDRVLAGLRSGAPDGTRDATTPVPGLDQLPELAQRFQGSGVDVRLRLDPALQLPRDLDLSAYRIVQEALTNVLKHAAPCTATAVVERRDGSLVIDVSDTGPGVRPTDRPGRGLLGIAERVSLYGGVLEHGTDGPGGFRLRAVLPLP